MQRIKKFSIKIVGIRNEEITKRSHQPLFDFPENFSKNDVHNIIRHWIEKNFKDVEYVKIIVWENIECKFESIPLKTTIKIKEYYLTEAEEDVLQIET